MNTLPTLTTAAVYITADNGIVVSNLCLTTSLQRLSRFNGPEVQYCIGDSVMSLVVIELPLPLHTA